MDAGLSHDEKVDNALRFLAAMVRPDQAWLIRTVWAEIKRLRKIAARKENGNAKKA